MVEWDEAADRPLEKGGLPGGVEQRYLVRVRVGVGVGVRIRVGVVVGVRVRVRVRARGAGVVPSWEGARLSPCRPR